MDTEKKGNLVALFDFDGVIMDTEPQYTIFWNENGKKYLGEENFGISIKGQTLTRIFDKHFAGREDIQQELKKALALFEKNMEYEYIPGAEEFLRDLKAHGVKTAIVTSSDKTKIARVFNWHPELVELVDTVITAEKVKRSKPAPDCFLLGMEMLESDAQHTVVFEDSFFGLQAARESGAYVVGLATTNPREKVGEMCDTLIDDFRGMSYAQLEKIMSEREK